MPAHQLRQAIAAAPRSALPALRAALYAEVTAGDLGWDEAAEIEAEIDRRARSGLSPARPARPADDCRQEAVQAAPEPAGTVVPPVQDRPARPGVGSRPHTSQSVERRRRWVASGWLPPSIASQCTPGEAAALAVIAWEVSRRGSCMLAIGAIAAHAGVSESTVRNGLRLGRRLRWLSVEERRLSRWRSDTNVVKLIVKEWTSWITHRGTSTRGGWVQTRAGHEYKKNLYRNQQVVGSFETSRHRSVTWNRDVDEQGVRSVTGRG